MSDNSIIEDLEKVPYEFKTAGMKYLEDVKELVSIVIPIYNAELYLKETLDSVLAQTYKNWEAILVDDGSTDKSSDICKEYVTRDSRFKYIHKKNEGTLLTRKVGLENSMGEFIANLDNDDIYNPLFLEKMLHKIKEFECDFVYCNYKVLGGEWETNYDEADNIISKNKFENVYQYNRFGNVVTWNKIVKREIYKKVLFPEVNIIIGEDRIQISQIVFHSERIGFVSEPLYLQRYRINSSSRAFNIKLIYRSYVKNVVWCIAFYLIMKRLFGQYDAVRISNDMNLFGYYFAFNKKERIHYKIEYAENFVPAFLRGLRKAKPIGFQKGIRNMVLILACNGFTLPVKIFATLLPIAKNSTLITKAYRKIYKPYNIPCTNINEKIEKVPYEFKTAEMKYPEEVKGLVSIIVPVYNAGLYLKEALDSIVAQTFENWEAILVDDGSTDNSSKICTEYVTKDNRFKYIRKNNEGSFLARMTGFENSRGEFITGLDSDDAYCPQFLERMFVKMNGGNNDFIWCDFKDLNGEEKFLYGKKIGAENFRFSKNKFENNCNFTKFGGPFLWNKLIKRSIIVKVLFPQIKAAREDQLLHLQIVYHSNNAEFIPEVLVLHRVISANSMSSDAYNIVARKKHSIMMLRSVIARYVLMKNFFKTENIEAFLVSGAFVEYFLLDKKTIEHYKIEYAENFIPAFLRGLKKSNKSLLHRIIFFMAYKGFACPLKFSRKIKEILLKSRRNF